MALASVYIDESGSHDRSPVLCLAGYVFKQRNARKFCAEWGKRLRREGLPYFRMSACAHGNEPFDDPGRWPVEKRIALEKALIRRIRQDASYGFAITVNEEQFNQIMPKHPDLGGAYAFCLRHCLIAVRSWATRVNFDRQFSYFFEAGHRDQAEANSIMNRVFAEPRLKESYRYISHSFADKQASIPLQAADLLAWQWHTDSKRRREGNLQTRKDCRALLEGQAAEVMDWSAERLRELAPQVASGRIRIIL